jgi:hypothetical protein
MLFAVINDGVYLIPGAGFKMAEVMVGVVCPIRKDWTLRTLRMLEVLPKDLWGKLGSYAACPEIKEELIRRGVLEEETTPTEVT